MYFSIQIWTGRNQFRISHQLPPRRSSIFSARQASQNGQLGDPLSHKRNRRSTSPSLPLKYFQFLTKISSIPTTPADGKNIFLPLLPDKALLSPLPHILHFSTQEPFTKYEICQFLASLSRPPIILDHTFIAVNDGPKAGETVRPKDCHLSNVSCGIFSITGVWECL